MTVLTIGYVHLMIFVALLFIFIIFTIGSCLLSVEDAERQVGHLSPVRLWLFIDEGFFSLLDDLEETEHTEQQNRVDQENRDDVVRRLALGKLEEKAFETVRLDTID
jgi:hypothetical protein